MKEGGGGGKPNRSNGCTVRSSKIKRAIENGMENSNEVMSRKAASARFTRPVVTLEKVRVPKALLTVVWPNPRVTTLRLCSENGLPPIENVYVKLLLLRNSAAVLEFRGFETVRNTLLEATKLIPCSV